MEVLKPFHFLWREFSSPEIYTCILECSSPATVYRLSDSSAPLHFFFFSISHFSLVLWHLQILMGSWVLPLWQHSSAHGNLNFVSTTLLKLPLAGSPNNDIHAAQFNGYFSSAIALDTSTVFDTIDHSVLLEILSSLSLHDSVLSWLSTYPSGHLFAGFFSSNQH